MKLANQSYVQLWGRPCIYDQETGWQSGVQSCILPGLPTHSVQELNVCTEVNCWWLILLFYSDQGFYRRPFHYPQPISADRRDISGYANNGNVGGNANAGGGSVNVGNGISNGKHTYQCYTSYGETGTCFRLTAILHFDQLDWPKQRHYRKCAHSLPSLGHYLWSPQYCNRLCILSFALPKERYPPGRHWPCRSLSIWVKCGQLVAV